MVVHSSYRRMGEVEGRAAGVIDALTDAVLPGGALLLPNLNIPHEFTADNPPRFDLKRDPLRVIGIIPEVFKVEFAEHFSLHPTHSVMGIGEKAESVLREHDKAGLPCGPGTPWAKNAEADGKILLIGATQKSNTTYHCAEEQIPDSYQLSRDVINGTVILDGVELVVPSRLHVWGNHPDFGILNPELEARGFLRRGRIGNADSLCLNARGFLDLAMEKLRVDPRYFMGGECR